MADDRMEKLQDTLAETEREAVQPVVPGEVLPWCRTVDGELEKLQQAWKRVGDQRRAAIEKILQEDMELANRVEALRGRERELGDALAGLRARVQALVAEDTEQPTASEEPLDDAQALRKEILAWIVEARAFDAEIDTWLVESTYRDRGDVD